MSISVLNTDAGLSAKTIVNAEDAQNVSGAKSFNRSPNPPFVVQAGSAVVPNLDADKVDGLEASAFTKQASNETITGTWNFDEIISADKGIQFPAVQVANAGVNVLDDYEEGTWTPVIGGAGGTSGQTYASQTGHYIKIGKLVYVSFNVTLSVKGTITGATQIQGLPFTCLAGASYIPGCPLTHWTGLNAGFVYLSALVVQGTTAASVFGTAVAAVALSSITTADLTNASGFHGNLFYVVS